MQGAIYELKKPDGKDSGQLLKVLKFKAVLPITGNDIGETLILDGSWTMSMKHLVDTSFSNALLKYQVCVGRSEAGMDYWPALE